ncbi:hypothetical protein ACFWXK_17495 [Streptomyces sp. NPDC059070]|uniref:hypothetical protein n=1 Tax=unclassified Streptomyces TaxID=2593676 RepID=UPI0034E25EE9
MRFMGKGLVLSAVGAALAVALAGCGSGDSAADPDGGRGTADRERGDEGGGGEDAPGARARAAVLAAARKTGAQSSYRTVQRGAKGEGHSEMLFQKSPSASVVKSWSSPSRANPSGFSHMVSSGGAVYVYTDELPGKSWYRMDGGPADGAASGGARAAGYVREFAGALAASPSTRRVGEEQVGGRPADHYYGRVVMDELAGYRGPALDDRVRDGYVATSRRAGLNTVFIEMWVGKDGLVLKSQERGYGTKGPELVVEEYSDFGAVPAIAPPPANTVATWKEFIDSLAQRS